MTQRSSAFRNLLSSLICGSGPQVRHLDRRRRFLPPQWRDPCISSQPEPTPTPIPAAAPSRGEEGATLVETALSIVILLTVIFGVFEICFAVYSYHFISEAAREGTRYAIVRGAGCSGFASACPASTTDIQTYVKSISFPGIDPTQMTVLPTWSVYTASGSTCPATAPCNSAGNLVTIQVKYNFPLAIPFIPARTLAMTSTSSMIISN